MKRIVVLPPPLTMAGLNLEDVVSYEKLTSILSLSDVLKYHRFNTMVATLLPEFALGGFTLVCYDEVNLNFIRTHSSEYEMICKKDTGKESKDDFYNVSGKIITKIDVQTDTIYLNVFGEGEESNNVKNFLNEITNVYGINSMMSIDTFKKYLIS